jgi:hypothetical protein
MAISRCVEGFYRMRARHLWPFLVTVAFAACGGGGGSTPPGSSPSPSPSPGSYRPAAGGDDFVYAGTLTQTTVRPPLSSSPAPSPNPTNSQTLISSVAQTVVVASGASFNGVANAFDFKTSETDTLRGGLETSTLTSDTYYAYEPSGAQTSIVELGSTTSGSNGVTTETLNGPGNGLVDRLPESAGDVLPTSTTSAAAVTSETDPDGQVTRRSTSPNGSYTETTSYPGGAAASAVANADGSGSYAYPAGSSTYGNAVFTVSAPTALPSVGPAIAVTLTVPPAPQTSATPGVETGAVAIWYPLPVALSTRTLVDEGTTSLPAACPVAASFARAAHLLVMTETAVDPVFGEIDQTTTQTYTEAGAGVACVQLNDAVEQFYDFSGQAGGLGVGSTPLQTTTVVETLGLASETLVGPNDAARTGPHDAARTAALHAAFFAAGLTNFRALLERRRAARHAAFVHALRARLNAR